MCHGYACMREKLGCEMSCKVSVVWSSTLKSNWDVTRYYRYKDSLRYDGRMGKGEARRRTVTIYIARTPKRWWSADQDHGTQLERGYGVKL